MALSDKVEDALAQPVAGEAAQLELGPDGGSFSGITSSEPITDWTHVFERFNLDPDVFEVVGDTVRMSMWQQSKRLENGERDVINLYSYRAQFCRKRDRLDIPALWQVARAKARKITKHSRRPATAVVVLADAQIGKTDLRGGTPELLERIAATLERLDQHLMTTAPERIVLADVGDLIEGFESGGDPHGTNDLSHPEQLELAATIVQRFVRVCSEHAPTTVVAVPSNHAKWRNGKQQLGKPTDDYGLSVHKLVESLGSENATWVFPESDFDEHAVVDVYDTRIGVVHGHQYAPGQAMKWWAGQAHGGSSVGAAEVLVTGHYHHGHFTTDGRNPATGRAKWHLQAPTLDNGSSWFRNIKGADSDPGLLVFDVTRDGFDLKSLTIL